MNFERLKLGQLLLKWYDFPPLVQYAAFDRGPVISFVVDGCPHESVEEFEDDFETIDSVFVGITLFSGISGQTKNTTKAIRIIGTMHAVSLADKDSSEQNADTINDKAAIIIKQKKEINTNPHTNIITEENKNVKM